MLQRQHDTEHSTSKQVIVEIMDKRNNMLIWTYSMTASRLRPISVKKYISRRSTTSKNKNARTVDTLTALLCGHS